MVDGVSASRDTFASTSRRANSALRAAEGGRPVRAVHLDGHVAHHHPNAAPSPADIHDSVVGPVLRSHSIRRAPDRVVHRPRVSTIRDGGPHLSMLVLIRHLFAIAALPFVVAVWIPTWLARRDGLMLTRGTTVTQMLVQIVGLCLLLIGLALFTSSLRRFAGDGKGTLAPWDPPRRLVVSGPYRYVRNPMISGVMIVLLGEALILLSTSHFWWFLTFF